MEADGEWDCTAASDSAMRRSLGLDTYRYLWAGNFSNISPVPWLGAYHWSDLLMIFGTYQDASGVIPQLEVDTSESMQDHILAFLKDPSTVHRSVGWTAFDPSSADGGKILEFGKGSPVKTITGDWLDAGCYNTSIPFRIWG
jgi:carboxylesterase type B